MAQRDQLEAALDFVREGDCLAVTRLCRLARSTKDFLEISERLHDKGVTLRILDFGGSAIDSQTATGKMMLTMFSAFAEFERSLLLERQRAGTAKAKAEGKYRGRAPTARWKASEIVQLKCDGCTPSEIADQTCQSLQCLSHIGRGFRMNMQSPEVGEQFANLTGMIEDAHDIAVIGQAQGLSKDEYRILLGQLRRQLTRTLDTVLAVAARL